MFLSNLSIKRPVFAAVMMLALVTLGLFSYRRLPIDLNPDVEIPVLTIVTVYKGASPESVEREVSKRVEEAVNPIAGVKHVSSISKEGVSTVIVEFELGVRINDATADARTKLAAVRGQLPQEIEDPIIQKLDVNGAPIVSVAVRSDSMSLRDLSTLVDKTIRRRLENVSGVGRLDVVGPAKREVSVEVDPRRLEVVGMGVDELIGGLQSENVNTPLGRLDRGGAEMPLRVAGRPKLVDQFDTMVIGQRNGAPIHLGDVATIVDGTEEQRSLAYVDGARAVVLDILKQTGANTVQTVENVKKEMTKLQAELPAAVKLELARDASTWIRDSVEDVQTTMIIGGFLTIVIVFLFLNSWRSTVITGLTLPISVISSFIVMYFAGMTLNVMTLMALSLAIGLLIDDAIVVRENIVRHLERGEDHFTAARNGTAEIGLAVLATSMSIMAVFVPVAFMKGIVGRFFFSFGITVAFAVLVSLFVSFTLDPMLSSRWFDPDIERGGRRSWIARRLDAFNDWFDRMADRYRALIAWALGHRKTVLALAALAFVTGIGAFAMLQSEFFPRFDAGEFQIKFTSAPDASIRETQDRMDTVLKIVHAQPEVLRTYSSIGAGDNGTVRDGKIYVKLKEKRERTRSMTQVQRALRLELAKIAGIVVSVEDQADQFSQKPVQMLVRGEDIGKLKRYAAQLKQGMYGVPGIVDIEVTLEHDIPEYRLSVDRERAVQSGVMTADISRAVGAMVGGQTVSTYEDADGDSIDVHVRLPQALRSDVEQVRDLRLTVHDAATGTTSLVPLGELVQYKLANTPSQIDRRDLRRQVVLSANLQDVALGTAIEKIQKYATDNIALDPGYSIYPAGDVEIMIESFQYMAEALLLAVIFVYLILAAQFESFIDPLSIMLSLPLSIVGMAGMLLLTGDTINIMSLIGLIMLMGLVTKNAILLVDFAKVLRKEGMDRTEALITAGRTRLRPIMMTTIAMIAGMIPLALAIGAGAEMRASMARAVIGGLITSTLLTLLVVPVVYTLFDDFAAFLARHSPRRPHERTAAEPGPAGSAPAEEGRA